MQVAEVLAGGVVSRLALLAIARFVDAQQEWAARERVARQSPADRPQLLQRPVRFREKVMERLMIRLRRLGQARQRLALGLGQQAQFHLRELLEMAHIAKHRPIVRTVLIYKGHRMRRFPCFGHGDASFRALRQQNLCPT